MERNYYTEGFESFLKDKSDQYKLYPSDKVWKNINRKLHPKRRWPYLAAALLLIGIGVGSKFYYDDTSSGFISNLGKTSGSATPASASENISAPEKSVNTLSTITGDHSRTRPEESPLRLAYVNPSIEKERNLQNLIQQTPGLTQDADELNYFKGFEISVPGQDEFTEADEVIINTPDAFSPGKLQTLNRVSNTSFLQKPVSIQDKKSSENELSLTSKLLLQLGRVTRKASWELYGGPSISYRRLIGKATDVPYNYTGTLYNTNASHSTDVNLAVHHNPLIGMEVGGAFVYPLSKNLRVRAGLQFNYNRYMIKAYNYKPEVATFGVDYSGANARSINTISYYRNYNGNSLTELRNERFMVSLPLGVEMSLFGNDKVKFNVASTIQPTYIFDNNSFLISTNLKNYAQEPRLYRNWNVNAGLEAFVSVKTGTVNWVVGPQFRYQLLSSYKDDYPISEHLIDYGVKIGVIKPLR